MQSVVLQYHFSLEDMVKIFRENFLRGTCTEKKWPLKTVKIKEKKAQRIYPCVGDPCCFVELWRVDGLERVFSSRIELDAIPRNYQKHHELKTYAVWKALMKYSLNLFRVIAPAVARERACPIRERGRCSSLWERAPCKPPFFSFSSTSSPLQDEAGTQIAGVPSALVFWVRNPAIDETIYRSGCPWGFSFGTESDSWPGIYLPWYRRRRVTLFH